MSDRNRLSMRPWKQAALTTGAMVLAITVAACSSSPTATPTPTATPEDHVAAGERLFREKGCATCHGQNAEGTGVAPALPGHTEEQVLRQVRNPMGRMPAFSTSQISDEELEQIADYIVSLGPGDGHDGGHMEPVDMGHNQVMEMHHWMALEAMQVGNVAEADHHIGHINDLTGDVDHLRLMEELLVDRVKPSLDMPYLHAHMAMRAMDVDDRTDARHHLQHIVDEGDDGDMMDMARSAMESMDAGDMGAARSMIEGMTGTGMGMGDGMGM